MSSRYEVTVRELKQSERYTIITKEVRVSVDEEIEVMVPALLTHEQKPIKD
jgi:hypothetical protein